MKKSNGFVASILLFSFFLLFCGIILTAISNYNHNINLINRITKNIQKSRTVPINNTP